jgi:hypothetical protein
MTPMLGIFASQITGHLQTDNGSMFPIRSYVVPSGGAASVTFSSIPSTYTHLQIRYTSRMNTAATWDYDKITFNSDTGSNYAWHHLYGNGASAVAGSATSQTYAYNGAMTSNNAGSNIFGATITDILDYSNSSKYKTVRSLTGYDNNGSGANDISKGAIFLRSGLWMNTNAITSITLTPDTGSFVQYSSVALYGVKA